MQQKGIIIKYTQPKLINCLQNIIKPAPINPAEPYPAVQATKSCFGKPFKSPRMAASPNASQKPCDIEHSSSK